MKYFDLTINSKIWIYGGGKIGHNAFENLTKCGYRVQGFIDKRADQIIAENNVNCLTLEEFSKEPLVSEYIVFVCVWNGTQQETIANMLFNIGCDKLVYLPMVRANSLDEIHTRRRAYNDFLMCNYDALHDIPCYCGTCCENIYTDEFPIITVSNHYVCFWHPVSELHTMCMDDFYSITNIVPGTSSSYEKFFMRYADIPLSHMTPYKNLYRRLSGDKFADLDDYFLLTKGDIEFDRNAFLADRKNLHEIFQFAYEYDMSFFSDSAAKCRWNEKGYFNVIDGLHSIFFLISKGKDNVPICVDIHNWEAFINHKRG